MFSSHPLYHVNPLFSLEARVPLISLQLSWARMKYTNYAIREHKKKTNKKKHLLVKQQENRSGKSSTKVLQSTQPVISLYILARVYLNGDTLCVGFETYPAISLLNCSVQSQTSSSIQELLSNVVLQNKLQIIHPFLLAIFTSSSRKL